VAHDVTSLANLATQVRLLTPGTSEREALLDRLASRIQSGEYQPDPDKIAEGLLRDLDANDPSEPER
jgi:anti-sigma28 factor (negative regulator of flagellin synthesis)